MLENLRQISKTDINQRREALIKILNNYELPYTIYHRKLRKHWYDNIIISFPHDTIVPKLVIGAHYDNIAGSCGANDNSSGVCILIEVAKYLQKNKVNIPVDIVFFDREEYADRGSEGYIMDIGAENINAMINIDSCGVGETVLIGPEKNLAEMINRQVLMPELLDKKYIEIIKHTPGSDDRSFESRNIPNISVCVVPKSDVKIIQTLISLESENIQPTKELVPEPPYYMSTVHNGSNDCIEIVEENAMKLILDFILSVFHLK